VPRFKALSSFVVSRLPGAVLIALIFNFLGWPRRLA
jgi:hypothetical protein